MLKFHQVRGKVGGGGGGGGIKLSLYLRTCHLATD